MKCCVTIWKPLPHFTGLCSRDCAIQHLVAKLYRLIKVIWYFRKFLNTFQHDMNMKLYTPSMKFHCRFTTELCQCEGYAQGQQKYEGYSGERSMQKSGEAEVHSH